MRASAFDKWSASVIGHFLLSIHYIIGQPVTRPRIKTAINFEVRQDCRYAAGKDAAAQQSPQVSINNAGAFEAADIFRSCVDVARGHGKGKSVSSAMPFVKAIKRKKKSTRQRFCRGAVAFAADIVFAAAAWAGHGRRPLFVQLFAVMTTTSVATPCSGHARQASAVSRDCRASKRLCRRRDDQDDALD